MKVNTTFILFNVWKQLASKKSTPFLSLPFPSCRWSYHLSNWSTLRLCSIFKQYMSKWVASRPLIASIFNHLRCLISLHWWCTFNHYWTEILFTDIYDMSTNVCSMNMFFILHNNTKHRHSQIHLQNCSIYINRYICKWQVHLSRWLKDICAPLQWTDKILSYTQER